MAFEGPVVLAGEVRVDHAMCVTAWNLKSGTYAIPHEHRGQSDLPAHLYWQFIDDFNADAVPANVMVACAKGGTALVKPKGGDFVVVAFL